MSTHPHLQDLLEQAAEAVPPAEVPRDTWQRGRRRHRRSLALRAAAVVGGRRAGRCHPGAAGPWHRPLRAAARG